MKPFSISEYFEVLGKSQKIYAKRLEPLCRKWDLTRNELDILLFLYNNPQFSRAADIVERRGIAKSHVSLAVTELERRALLVRQSVAEDRRAAGLHLTDSGYHIAQEGRQLQEQFFRQLYRDIPPEELARWADTSQKIRNNIGNLKTETD